jgi:hypothetical protein
MNGNKGCLDEPHFPSDCILEMMLRERIPLTQRNYIELAYMGDKSSLEELEGEERAALPVGFEDWPVDEVLLN